MHAVVSTTVSPIWTTQDPSACLAILPVSRVMVADPIETSLRNVIF
jgi:hypothetical protein